MEAFMPNYFAHSVFGQRVFHYLSPELQRQVDQQWESYACGQYGPDPLFFYRFWRRNLVAQEGHALHGQTPQSALERMRRPVEEEQPFALGYAMGFLCHFMLDSSCHPYVYEMNDRGEISHLAMEGEFDRHLMREAGIIPHQVTPMDRPVDPLVFEAAASAYEHVSPGQFREGMKVFYQVCRMLTRFQGTVFCPAVDVATKPVKNAHRMLLRKTPDPASYITTPQLLKRFDEAVEPAAQLADRLYDAYRQGTSLNFLPPMNFQGKLVLE
jgi:hypothetical protein